MTEETERPAILPFLRREIFHTTSRDSLRAILDLGEIRPSGEFEHATSYRPDVHYGGRCGYVCLFDFETPTEEECLNRYRSKWGNVLRYHSPVTVAIKLRRSAIPNLIPNKPPELVRDEHGQLFQPSYIPKVEVWSADPIPTSAILAYIVIDATDIEKFREFPVSGDDRSDLTAIDSIARDFRKDSK